MGQILSSLLEIFYTKKLDIVVIGLENRSVRLVEMLLLKLWRNHGE